MSKHTIALGCDHAGFVLKNDLINMLHAEGFVVKDYGTNSTDSVDYPDYVHPVATLIEKGETTFGILICGSANGVAMTANKYQKIRAAICWNNEIAALARQHNNANIICLPARFISKEQAKSMVKIFLHTAFEGGRHLKRVEKIPIKNS